MFLTPEQKRVLFPAQLPRQINNVIDALWIPYKGLSPTIGPVIDIFSLVHKDLTERVLTYIIKNS